MGGGASKRKRLAEEEAAATAKALTAKDEAKRSEEEQFRAYQASLRQDHVGGEDEHLPKQIHEENIVKDDSNYISIDGNMITSQSSAKSVVASVAPSARPEPEPASMEEPTYPEQILNLHVFEPFSEEFKCRFIEDRQRGQPDPERRSGSRYKQVDKVKIPIHGGGETGSKFDISLRPWLQELCAVFDPAAVESGEQEKSKDKSSSTSLSSGCARTTSDTFLVEARGRSLATIKEVNKTHLGASCLALDLSSNRFTQINFKHVLTHLLYLNVSGNLLVSLDGIHCCKSLKGINAANNLISSLRPLRYLRSLEALNLSSNKLCRLLDEEEQHPEVHQLPQGGSQQGEHQHPLDWSSLPPLLRVLDVSYNADMCSLLGVAGTPCLTHLDCSACSVTKLEEDLSHLVQLTTLKMRRNKIVHLSDVTGVFPSLTSLTSIDLSENEFVEEDGRSGKGVYHLAMLQLSEGRLKMLDDRKILEKDYKRFDALKSEVRCEELVANLNVECTDKMQKMQSILDNLAARHRLEEEVLREAIRSATATEKQRCGEYTSFVNEQLRALKMKEDVTQATAMGLRASVEAMKEGAPQYVQLPHAE